MELFFDTETSDKLDFKNPPRETSAQFPWVVQLGAILAEAGEDGEPIIYGELNLIIKAEGRTIASGAQEVHNIPVELSERVGVLETTAIKTFMEMVRVSDTYICHNVSFDQRMIRAMIQRTYPKYFLRMFEEKPSYCTMLETTNLCKLPGRFGSFKWPKLIELHKFLFGEGFSGAHDAMFDIKATMRCYYELKRRGWVK